MEQSPGAESPWISLFLAAPWSQLAGLGPITPRLPEGKGRSRASGETPTQFADFSENAVGMILIPGSTGEIKRAREAVLDTEWESCSAGRTKGIGNFLVEAAGYLNQPRWQPKLPLLDPTQGAEMRTESPRGLLYFTPCPEQAPLEPFLRQHCSQPFAFYCHSLFHFSSNPALDVFPSPLWPIWCLCRAVLWPCLNFTSFGGYFRPFLPFPTSGSQL